MAELKTPRGCFDTHPLDAKTIQEILHKCTKVFKKFGAVLIDTPSFELSTILKNKYGDDAKLIYDLEKTENSENYSLRYDLTVSLCRYLAQHKIKKLRRYQTGKVFRRDLPNIKKGRFCEFWQCDFDICGEYMSMVADAEVLRACVDILKTLCDKPFNIRVNHRKLHVACFQLLNIDEKLHNSVCSSIDKLDKHSLEDIANELVVKGLEKHQIDAIFEYVQLKGTGNEFLESLKENKVYLTDQGKIAVDELLLLLDYLKIFGVDKYVTFDLKLSRGTDYYTGMVFEASFLHSDAGTVVAGGRYDDVVKNFVKNQATENIKRNDSEEFHVPCVGLSVGVCRLFSIIKQDSCDNNQKVCETKVFVSNFGSNMLKERLVLLNELWDAQIPAETSYSNANYRKQAVYANKNSIPIIVTIGESEIENGTVQVAYGRDPVTKYVVKRTELIDNLREVINKNDF